MGDTEGEATGANIPEVELIIKASTIDGRRKGACLFCQVCFQSSTFVKTKNQWFQGILHGLVPTGRVENNRSEDNNRGHAEATSGLQIQFWLDSTSDPDRCRCGHPREREDWETHHEGHPRRTQPFCSGNFSPIDQVKWIAINNHHYLLNRGTKTMYVSLLHVILKSTCMNFSTLITHTTVERFWMKRFYFSG